MCTFLAHSSIRAEPRKIEVAYLFSHVLLGAQRTKRAVTAFVVGAWGKLGSRVDVQKEAFIAGAAVQGPRVLVAFRHAASAVDQHVSADARLDLCVMRHAHALMAWIRSAAPRSCKEILQIVFMEELALIAFLAETTQPMFADQAVEGVRHLVFVGAVVAQGAVPFAECFAYRTARVKTEPVFPFEEVGEGEVEGWRWRILRKLLIQGC